MQWWRVFFQQRRVYNLIVFLLRVFCIHRSTGDENNAVSFAIFTDLGFNVGNLSLPSYDSAMMEWFFFNKTAFIVESYTLNASFILFFGVRRWERRVFLQPFQRSRPFTSTIYIKITATMQLWNSFFHNKRVYTVKLCCWRDFSATSLQNQARKSYFSKLFQHCELLYCQILLIFLYSTLRKCSIKGESWEQSKRPSIEPTFMRVYKLKSAPMMAFTRINW